MARLSTTEKENLSKNLKHIQKSRQLTVEKMARLCDIPLRTFESYFYGQKSPSEMNLKSIAKEFRLTPTALISSDARQTYYNEQKIYNTVCYIRDGLLASDPFTLIGDYINTQFPGYNAFVRFLNAIGYSVIYIPAFSKADIKEMALDDISGINILKVMEEIMEKKITKHTIDSIEESVTKDTLQFINERINASNKTDEEKENIKKEEQEKMATYLNVAKQMINALQKDTPASAQRAYALQYILDDIDQERYDITSKAGILRLPIKVEVFRMIENPNLEDLTSVDDIKENSKTYSLTEFIDLMSSAQNNISELLR